MEFTIHFGGAEEDKYVLSLAWHYFQSPYPCGSVFLGYICETYHLLIHGYGDSGKAAPERTQLCSGHVPSHSRQSSLYRECVCMSDR